MQRSSSRRITRGGSRLAGSAIMPATRREEPVGPFCPRYFFYEIIFIVYSKALVRRSLRFSLSEATASERSREGLPPHGRLPHKTARFTRRDDHCFVSTGEKSPCVSHLKEGPFRLFSRSTQYCNCRGESLVDQHAFGAAEFVDARVPVDLSTPPPTRTKPTRS